jgi:hypothetical protein
MSSTSFPSSYSSGGMNTPAPSGSFGNSSPMPSGSFPRSGVTSGSIDGMNMNQMQMGGQTGMSTTGGGIPGGMPPQPTFGPGSTGSTTFPSSGMGGPQ